MDRGRTPPFFDWESDDSFSDGASDDTAFIPTHEGASIEPKFDVLLTVALPLDGCIRKDSRVMSSFDGNIYGRQNFEENLQALQDETSRYQRRESGVFGPHFTSSSASVPVVRNVFDTVSYADALLADSTSAAMTFMSDPARGGATPDLDPYLRMLSLPRVVGTCEGTGQRPPAGHYVFTNTANTVYESETPGEVECPANTNYDPVIGMNLYFSQYDNPPDVRRSFWSPTSKVPTQSSFKSVSPFASNSTKKFQCPDCKYQTNRKGDFDRHLESLKHSERQYKCKQCELTFTRKNSLRRHKQTSCPGVRKLSGLDGCMVMNTRPGRLIPTLGRRILPSELADY